MGGASAPPIVSIERTLLFADVGGSTTRAEDMTGACVEATAWREAALIEFWGAPATMFAAVRTDRWKYVEYADGSRELYDLTADPYEMQNLAREHRWEATILELRSRLSELRR